MALKIHSGPVGGALKVVLYGPEGIGKSTLASRFPRPLFIDTEGSTRHMDVSRTETPSSWTMLLEQVKAVRDAPSLCATLVLDTADWAEMLCISHICAENHVTGLESFGYGKGYVYLAEEFGRLLNLLSEVIARGVTVVVTAHAMMRKFEQPDEMGAYDRWELKLQRKTAPLLKEWADLVLFANYKTVVVAADKEGKKHKAQGGRRVLYTAHHPCWDAKNRLGLPEELPMDFGALAPYIRTGTVPPAPVTPGLETAAPPPASAPVPPPPPPKETVPSPASAPEATSKPAQGKPQNNTDALKALRDLMGAEGVLDHQVQAAVAAKGYFPEETPLENLPEDFIRGVLIGAWPAVSDWIKTHDPLPF